ncbi:MAG: IS1182 family transposase [Gammaproteobacteria bacterium]
MAGFVEGMSRDQATLFPERLDELIGADAPVRAVDAFVDTLDMQAMEFTKAVALSTGRPPYDPADMVKLYVYGHLHQVRSSRRLERECHCNIEVLWLLNRLTPDFKTIADFRRDNRDAIARVCRTFVQFCRQQGLFGAELVAIDGSKFAAQNSPQKAFTTGQIEREVKRLDERIEAYLAGLDAADASEETDVAPGDARAALAALRDRRADVAQALALMDAMKLSQVTLTDPDSRLMRASGGGSVVGYNVQIAVDDRHGLIAHHEVTQDVSDQNQLVAVAQGAKEALGCETLQAVADSGYADAEQIKQCEDDGVTPFVPHPRSTNTQGAFFDKSQFVYEPEQDQYRCPAGEVLRFHSASTKKQASNYVGVNCAGCALKPGCTKAAARWVTRHLYEEELDRLAARMEAHPEMMKRRAALAEHPFGILKAMMGYPRFLCRGLEAVTAEMNLCVLAFNLKRAIAILGTAELLKRLAPA